MKLGTTIASLVVTILCGCLNTFEKETVGFYKVEVYEFGDSAVQTRYDIPTLKVKSNRTFSLDFTNKKIEGRWRVSDYGDWTVVDFYDSERSVQGQIGIDEIKILNPWQFDCPFLKTMVFKKRH